MPQSSVEGFAAESQRGKPQLTSVMSGERWLQGESKQRTDRESVVDRRLNLCKWAFSLLLLGFFDVTNIHPSLTKSALFHSTSRILHTSAEAVIVQTSHMDHVLLESAHMALCWNQMNETH